MESPQYAVQLLPKRLDRLLVRRFAALDLDALRAINDRILPVAPQHAKTVDHWEEKLSQPDHCCFVLLAPNIETGAVSLEEGQWVGKFTVQGPLEPGTNEYPTAEDHPSAVETRWSCHNLFCKEAHRNLDAFQLLGQASEGHVERETRQRYSQAPEQKVYARLQYTARYGSVAHEYHMASGAKVLAELSREQVLHFNGYLEDAPKEFLDEDRTELIGTVFEMVIEYTI